MEEILDLEGGKNKIKKRGRTSVILFLISIVLMSLPILIGVLSKHKNFMSEIEPATMTMVILPISIGYLIGIVLGFIGFVYSINAFRKKEVGKFKFVGLVGNGLIVLSFFFLIVSSIWDIFYASR